MAGVRLLAVEGKIGGGTGYVARRIYVLAPTQSKGKWEVIWSALSHSHLAASEFLPAGTQPYVIDACLLKAESATLAY
jgi:hypothetical protein